MSTRANIILKEGNDKLYFYRHSDGYPAGTMPTLNILVNWMKERKIRNDLQQGSGWLILLGAMEYNTLPKFELEEPHFKGGHAYGNIETIQQPADWKCGAYEPTTEIHGDIEYLYTVDLEKKTIEAFSVNRVGRDYDHSNQVFTPIPEKELKAA